MHFLHISCFLYLFFACIFWFLWPATSSQKRAREVLPAFFRLAFLTLLTQMNEQTAVSATQLQERGQKRGRHLLLQLPAQGAKKHGAAVHRRRRFQYIYIYIILLLQFISNVLFYME